MEFFKNHAPPLIDRYLDIQYILGLNSSIGAVASMNVVRTRGSAMVFLMLGFYRYLLMVILFSRYPSPTRLQLTYHFQVERQFSCLTSPLNELEESTSTAAEQAMDREASLPYTPHSSDSPSFALALAFPTIQHIEYRVDELVLPAV
jgi:hypothetical protein